MQTWEWILSAFLNIVCGLLSGVVVTLYYRKYERKKELYSLVYGLHSYLRLIKEATDDYIKTSSTDWLKSVLAEEPYKLLIDLNDHKVDEEKKKAIILSNNVISEMQMFIKQENITELEAKKYVIKLAQASFALLVSNQKK